jgi:arabinogalactan endo-1,4-beta-galactosidase
LKRHPLLALGVCVVYLLLVPIGATGSPADSSTRNGYYQSIQQRENRSLRVALHDLIEHQQSISYDSVWSLFKETDRTSDGRVREMYSRCDFRIFRPRQSGQPGTVCGFLTREHVWPRTTWDGALSNPNTDLFNVLPADAHVNGQKGISPPGEVGPDARKVGTMKFGPGREGLGYRGQVFEPPDRYKGDFARIYFYVVVRYLTDNGASRDWPLLNEAGDDLAPWAQSMLLRWHRNDPVSDFERRRNNAVYEIQGNRNPFVDHPEWARTVWGDTSDSRDGAFSVGVDANYYLRMKDDGDTWSHRGRTNHPFEQFASRGIEKFRVRLWVGDTGPHGLEYATKTARLAQEHGMDPYLVLFLSDGWADYVKQPVPDRWADMTVTEQARAVRQYAGRVARHFQERGIEINRYEIGNEIDFGISGRYEKRWSHRFNMEWMTTKIWPDAAQIIRGAQEGIRKINPDAGFVLHLAQWWNPSFVTRFVRTMRSQDVSVDDVGLSYFPTANMVDKHRLEDLEASVETISDSLDIPVVIPEFAYPSSKEIPGQFSEWNQSVPGYELSEAGQRRWLRDFVRRARTHPDIKQIYYWSPEWYTGNTWPPFALFDEEGRSKPVLEALGGP